MKGILITDKGDLNINVVRDTDGKIKRGLVLGDTLIQNAYSVLKCNQGELKEDPIAGANLVEMIRGRTNKEKILKVVNISLERVGVKFDNIKGHFEVIINKIVV